MGGGERVQSITRLFFPSLDLDLDLLSSLAPPASPHLRSHPHPGYRIGRALAERASLRRDGLRHPTTLDAVKHACKEIWAMAFGKQVDALRTNHRGTFVLRDAAFRRLASLSADAYVPAAKRREKAAEENGGGGEAAAGQQQQQRDAAASAAATTLRLHAGIVRGALSALGVEADVTAASPVPPAAEFTVIVRSDDDGE